MGVTVSIIIPIYNSGICLENCLKSILELSFTDYECIMVDDGSDAFTASIVDRFADIDNRFVAIHKTNSGVSDTRNVGLSQATGDWIVFVDSDDTVSKQHLSIFEDKRLTESYDLICCSAKGIHKSKVTYHIYENNSYKGDSAVDEFLSKTDAIKYMMPWDKFFSHSIIKKHNLKFNSNLSLGEDRLFCYQFLVHTSSILTIDNVSYIHDASNMNSLSYKSYSSRVNKYKYEVFKDVTKKLIQKHNLSDVAKEKLYWYLEEIFLLIINSYKSENNIIRFYYTRILHKLHLL